MKKLSKALLIMVCVACVIGSFVLKKLPDKTATVPADDGKNNIAIESALQGEWYCSEINSCNNMKIFLSVTQEGNDLYIVRDMKSEKNSQNGSLLEGLAEIIDENSAYAEFVSAQYSLTEDGYLLEYFEKNARWNIYTKGFYDQPIEGRYSGEEN